MITLTLLQLRLNMKTAALLCHHAGLCQKVHICEDGCLNERESDEDEPGGPITDETHLKSAPSAVSQLLYRSQ